MSKRRTSTWLASAAVALCLSGCARQSYWNGAPNGNPWAGRPNLPNTSAPLPGTTLPPPNANLPGSLNGLPRSSNGAIPNANLPPTAGGAMSVPTPSLPGVANLPPGSSARKLFPSIQRPNWNSPGTIQQQQQRATVFDPFADNFAAPEIVGGRPREFNKPTPHAEQADTYSENFSWPW
ncbi:MAG: hypothetical protein R3C28_27730 [Pirellulaceae bacterium]